MTDADNRLLAYQSSFLDWSLLAGNRLDKMQKYCMQYAEHKNPSDLINAEYWCRMVAAATKQMQYYVQEITELQEVMPNA